MKSLFILLSLFASFTFSSFAGNGETQFIKRITNKIYNPMSNAQAGDQLDVRAMIRVTRTGLVRVVYVNSSDKQVSQEIKKQIEEMKLSITPEMYGKNYSFSFVLIKE